MTEVLEAVITCKKCEECYPVIAGVLIAVPDVESYMRKQFGFIVSNCTLHGGISSHIIRYMLDRGYNLAKVESREYYDSPKKLSTYICSHYDNVAQLVPLNNSLGQYLHRDYQDFYSTVLNGWKQKVPPASETKRALDVGTYVGGVVSRLSNVFERVYGIDYSFAGILTARQLQIGHPTQITTYDLYLEGNNKQQRHIQAPLKTNVDFLVASALNLPFRSATFNLTTSFNLLELVSKPKLMVQEMLRVSKFAADIILTSPYWWEEDEVDVSEWIGGRAGYGTTNRLKTLFEELRIALIAEQSEVPWILRYNSRAFMSFINTALIGRVIK